MRKTKREGDCVGGAEAQKMQCVFGINEVIWQQKRNRQNRREDGVELRSFMLSRTFLIALPLP